MFDRIDDLWDRIERWKAGSTSKGCLVEAAQTITIILIVILSSFGCAIVLIVGGMWLCGGS